MVAYISDNYDSGLQLQYVGELRTVINKSPYYLVQCSVTAIQSTVTQLPRDIQPRRLCLDLFRPLFIALFDLDLDLDLELDFDFDFDFDFGFGLDFDFGFGLDFDFDLVVLVLVSSAEFDLSPVLSGFMVGMVYGLCSILIINQIRYRYQLDCFTDLGGGFDVGRLVAGIGGDEDGGQGVDGVVLAGCSEVVGAVVSGASVVGISVVVTSVVTS